jgi:hypothetical protein
MVTGTLSLITEFILLNFQASTIFTTIPILLLFLCLFMMLILKSEEAELVEIIKKGCSEEKFLEALRSRMYTHSDKEMLIKYVFPTMFSLESKYEITRNYYSGTHVPILLWSLQEEIRSCKKDVIWDLKGLTIKEMWKSCEELFRLYGRGNEIINQIGKELYRRLELIGNTPKELNDSINNLEEIEAHDSNLVMAKRSVFKLLKDIHYDKKEVVKA